MNEVQEATRERRSFSSRLPSSITPALRRLSIASLVGQIILIMTGGAVRLTSSGLGCPTWPDCTASSFVNTPQMGIHGIIEFSNRMLTFALAFVVLALLVMLWNLRKERKDLFWLTFSLLASIPVQAVIGGISVLTKLNPWVVSLHFLVSAALVVFSMLLVNRTYNRSGQLASPPAKQPVKTARQLSIVAALCTGLAVIFGTMVTGSGPHSGDALSPRNDLNPYLITRVHVLPVYVLVFASIVLVVLLYRRGSKDVLRKGALWLLAGVIFQGIVGYVQYFNALPPTLVDLHMLGAALLLAAATNLVDLMYRRKGLALR